MQVKRQQLEPDMEQWTGSKLGKGYIKAVYCHPVYLTSMQSTPFEKPGWMPPSSAGNAGSIPGWGTKIPHVGVLRLQSPCTTVKILHAATKTQHSQK